MVAGVIGCDFKSFFGTSGQWLNNKLKKNTPTIPITYRPTSLPINTYKKPIYDKFTKLGMPIIYKPHQKQFKISLTSQNAPTI